MTPLTISAVHLSKSIAYGPKSNKLVSVPCVSLTLSDRSSFKGDGILAGSERLNPDHQAAIEAELNRILKDQPADDFFTLCERVATSSYITEEWLYPEPDQETGDELLKKNRRDMLTVFGVVEQKMPEKVLTPVTHTLPAIVVRALTAALLRAVAHTQTKSITELVQTLLASPTPLNTRPNLGLDVSLASEPLLLSHAAALCYTVPAASTAESLGKTGEKFQKYLRDLGTWIADSWSRRDPADRPSLFVDLNGAIHRLNGNITGKTLGSLFGFSTTGNQEKMIFANAVINSTPLKTANDMALLQSLVKSRKLKLKLAAGEYTNTHDDVSLWLEKSKPEIILLKEIETANLGELLKIIKTINSSETNLIIIGGNGGNRRSWELIHTIAQLATPEIYIPAGEKHGMIDLINRYDDKMR